jgi:histidinol-phosphatase
VTHRRPSSAFSGGEAGPHDLLRFLGSLADDADAVALEHARDVGRVDRKADDSPVTAADREVERVLRARLERERPGEAIVGEEGGGAIGGRRPGRSWLLDPIDGTAQFARGVPVWATLIGVVEDGAPVAGMVSAPALGRRWWGARGEPSPWRVSDVDDFGEALFSVSRLWWADAAARGRIDALALRCWTAGGYESFFGPVLVAEGAIDIAVMPEVEPWDVVPLQAVVEAAGGRCSPLDCGGPRIGALFSNARLHDAALEALRAA